MNSTKIDITYEELQILIQYIQSLNCPGTEVHRVGLLMDKLLKEKIKMEQRPPKEVK